MGNPFRDMHRQSGLFHLTVLLRRRETASARRHFDDGGPDKNRRGGGAGGGEKEGTKSIPLLFLVSSRDRLQGL